MGRGEPGVRAGRLADPQCARTRPAARTRERLSTGLAAFSEGWCGGGILDYKSDRGIQSVFSQLGDERLVADLQDLRGAAAVARRFSQRLLDLAALHLREHATRGVAQRSGQ